MNKRKQNKNRRKINQQKNCKKKNISNDDEHKDNNSNTIKRSKINETPQVSKSPPIHSQLNHHQEEHEENKEEESQETSTFHGSSLYDYQGRSYMSINTSIDIKKSLKCHIPKKHQYTFLGHEKGVTAIRWLPYTSHLLLSSSMDHTVKIWDIYNHKQCLRTYYGHNKAVKDINFSYDGQYFITASYDGYIKYWNTETGQCIDKRLMKNTIPYCAILHPESSNSSEILVGQKNKQITMWDIRNNDNKDQPIQTYQAHQSAINHIIFADNNRKFISTADDKKILIWEYGLPVVVAHIAEPDMYSSPYLVAHPHNGYNFLAQSMDNQILTYDCTGKFMKKKI